MKTYKICNIDYKEFIQAVPAKNSCKSKFKNMPCIGDNNRSVICPVKFKYFSNGLGTLRCQGFILIKVIYRICIK